MIKRNRILYGIGMLIKYRNDDAYYNRILNRIPGYFQLLSNTIKPTKTVYLIDIADDTVAGFFAIMRTILSSMYLADSLEMKIYVRVTGSLYNMAPEDNMYEYFFLQTMEENYESITQKYNCFKFERKHSQVVDNALLGNYSIVNGYDITQDYISAMAKMYAKYIKFNEKTELELNENIDRLLNGKKVLGIHIRGTDFAKAFKGHPIQLRAEDYFELIDSILVEYGFEKIFVATDENGLLDKFKNKYLDMVIAYEGVYRSENNRSIHSQINSKGLNGYQIAKEVLRDMYTLASCNGLLAGKSQVSLMAIICKESKDKRYEYIKVIDKGTN